MASALGFPSQTLVLLSTTVVCCSFTLAVFFATLKFVRESREPPSVVYLQVYNTGVVDPIQRVSGSTHNILFLLHATPLIASVAI